MPLGLINPPAAKIDDFCGGSTVHNEQSEVPSNRVHGLQANHQACVCLCIRQTDASHLIEEISLHCLDGLLQHRVFQQLLRCDCSPAALLGRDW